MVLTNDRRFQVVFVLFFLYFIYTFLILYKKQRTEKGNKKPKKPKTYIQNGHTTPDIVTLRGKSKLWSVQKQYRKLNELQIPHSSLIHIIGHLGLIK